MNYDLIVIGSGPGGQKGAIAAAKMGKRVALIERRETKLGGVCLHTGTIPSKTMREAIIHLTGFLQKEVYADRYWKKRQITMADLKTKLNQVIHDEMFIVHDQLSRNGIDLYSGEARFVEPRVVEIDSGSDDDRSNSDKILLYGENILVACGTKPHRPENIPFDGKYVFDGDEILEMESIPRSMIVVGGGVIGLEYAIMFAALGVNVTVVDGRERLLDFCDREIIDMLVFNARAMGISFRMGESVENVLVHENGPVLLQLESQKHLIAETAFFSVGRVGDVDALNPSAAGLEVDKRGRLSCDENYRTHVDHIYAVGDVIGFPSLASVSAEQGRRAVDAIYGQSATYSDLMPYGLYTIPEVSMVGKNEQELTAERVPYEIGVANFSELAKCQISGTHSGMLKILFSPDSRKILGVHCIGDASTEIIHIGQAVMALGGTLDYFADNVFNFPTMAESYKIAALDGMNRCRSRDLFNDMEKQTSNPSDINSLTVEPAAVLTPAASSAN